MDKKMILQAKELSKTFSNESVQQHVLKNPRPTWSAKTAASNIITTTVL